MNTERLLQVIVGPHVTEKATLLAEQRQIAFKVARTATKVEIKQAVESLFNVKVDSVSTMNVKGKSRRFAQRLGRRNHWKKAIVTLHEGEDLHFATA